MTTATSEMNRKQQDFNGLRAINNKKETGSNLFLTSTHFASNKVIYGHWVLFRTRNQPILKRGVYPKHEISKGNNSFGRSDLEQYSPLL